MWSADTVRSPVWILTVETLRCLPIGHNYHGSLDLALRSVISAIHVDRGASAEVLAKLHRLIYIACAPGALGVPVICHTCPSLCRAFRTAIATRVVSFYVPFKAGQTLSLNSSACGWLSPKTGWSHHGQLSTINQWPCGVPSCWRAYVTLSVFSGADHFFSPVPEPKHSRITSAT